MQKHQIITIFLIKNTINFWRRNICTNFPGNVLFVLGDNACKIKQPFLLHKFQLSMFRICTKNNQIVSNLLALAPFETNATFFILMNTIVYL